MGLCGSSHSCSELSISSLHTKSNYRAHVVRAYIHQIKLLLLQQSSTSSSAYTSESFILAHIPHVINEIIELFYDKYQIFNQMCSQQTQLPTHIVRVNHTLYIKDFNDELHSLTDFKHKNEIKSVKQSIFNNNHQIIELQNKTVYTHYTTNNNNRSYPKKISYFKSKNVNIIQIDCGKAHTLFLSHNGLVYAMGENNVGQCGIIKTKQGIRVNNANIKKPTLIQTFVEQKTNITAISCGEAHNGCIDDKGQIWMFGQNTSKECCNCCSNHENYIYLPRKQTFYCVKKVKCGNDFTVILNENGYCYMFGNINHECAENFAVMDIYVGYQFVAWVTEFGEIYSLLHGPNSQKTLHTL